MTQRTERIDELLRQEIGELLSREVSDPRIGFVTVTRVETAPDLSHARVWVSLIGQKAERAAALTALRGAMPFIRHRLGDKIRIRRIPDLHVELDDTAERGTRVLQLLHELEEGRTPEETPIVGETLPTPTARIPVEGEEPVVPAAPAPGRKGPRRPSGPAGRTRPGASRGQGGSGGPGGKGPGGSGGRGGKGPGSQRPARDRRGSDRS